MPQIYSKKQSTLLQIINKKVMREILKKKKVHIITTFGVAAVAAVILFQGSIPRELSSTKLSSISPNQGIAGTEVVLSGSGFSSSVEGITGTMINKVVYAPGNYVLVQGDVAPASVLSPDGKTLTVRINPVSDKVRTDCEAKLSSARPEPCKLQIKVVNAYGKVSNGQYFTITGFGNPPPVAQSCTLMIAVASTTPIAQTISLGQSATLVKFNGTPDCDGTLKSFAVSLLPMPSNYTSISALRLYDDVSGMQLGATQSVTGPSINFTGLNIPLMTGSTLVFRVVGDAAKVGSVYGTFGGSYGVTASGDLIGNNTSGVLFSGNVMTIAAQ